LPCKQKRRGVRARRPMATQYRVAAAVALA
jgi:hypothetical protein